MGVQLFNKYGLGFDLYSYYKLINKNENTAITKFPLNIFNSYNYSLIG